MFARWQHTRFLSQGNHENSSHKATVRHSTCLLLLLLPTLLPKVVTVVVRLQHGTHRQTLMLIHSFLLLLLWYCQFGCTSPIRHFGTINIDSSAQLPIFHVIFEFIIGQVKSKTLNEERKKPIRNEHPYRMTASHTVVMSEPMGVRMRQIILQNAFLCSHCVTLGMVFMCTHTLNGSTPAATSTLFEAKAPTHRPTKNSVRAIT